MKVRQIRSILFLLFTFFVYSSSSIFGKLASLQKQFSLLYFLYFGCVIASMGMYAILWQKVLEKLQLNKAYLYKSCTILIILLVSSVVFGEVISLNNIIGACFIIVGICILAWKK